MWERELEAGNEELPDVGTTNVVRLFDLDDAENLIIAHVSPHVPGARHVRRQSQRKDVRE